MRVLADSTRLAFTRLCSQHTTVIPSEGYTLLRDGDEQQRAVAVMQQETGALRADVARLHAEQAQQSLQPMALMDHAERLGGLGSWEWIVETGEVRWSDNLFRIHGLQPRSVTPSLDLVLDFTHPADVADVIVAMATLANDGDIRTVEYRIVRSDTVVRHLRATVESAGGVGQGAHLVGSIQDVTDEQRTARQMAGRAAVSRALDEWHEFEPGARDLLAGLAGAMDFRLGVVWVPMQDVLTARVIWHDDHPALHAIADATREWQPGHGSPIVGLAWASGAPVVSNRCSSGAPAARAAALRAAGVKSAIAIPAVVEGEVLVVLEFLSCELLVPGETKLRSLTGIGHEIGHFLGRRRGELAAPLLTARELQVLQLAARALTARQIADKMFVSPATVKRHFEDAYARLGVSDRASAVAQAMRQGMID